MSSCELIAVACLDEVENGVIRRIPRHVTVVPWFALDVSEVGSLQNEFASVLRHVAPVEIVGGEEAKFGPDNDVQVRRVGERVVLLDLHLRLKEVVERFGGRVRDVHYTGMEGYQPHVSKQEDGYFGDGERHMLDRLQLIEAIQSAHGKRNILAQFPLEG